MGSPLASRCVLEGCPKIESLLRKSGFWPIFSINIDKIHPYISCLWAAFTGPNPLQAGFVVKYVQYSPHLIEKMNSKPRSLVAASILGQPPSQFSSQKGLYR